MLSLDFEDAYIVAVVVDVTGLGVTVDELVSVSTFVAVLVTVCLM